MQSLRAEHWIQLHLFYDGIPPFPAAMASISPPSCARLQGRRSWAVACIARPQISNLLAEGFPQVRSTPARVRMATLFPNVSVAIVCQIMCRLPRVCMTALIIFTYLATAAAIRVF